jgi:tetratricopeptide (TPR) repeat protein
MNARKTLVLLVSLFSFGCPIPANAKLSDEQLYSLFSRANEAFRQAHSISDNSNKATELYEEAILIYEKIISEGHIQNSKLYYNLGNAYFLKGDLGEAILNYRRAETLDSADTNIQKNLAFARSRRVDKVKLKTEKRVLHTLFFWHYDFSLKTKFALTCLFFALFCVSLAIMIWVGRNAPGTVTAVISGCFFICLFSSVFLEANNQARKVCGVITAEEVVARQGDGQSYSPSFKDPLHAGTEFDLLEHRHGWLHIKLSDNSEGWIPDTNADMI